MKVENKDVFEWMDTFRQVITETDNKSNSERVWTAEYGCNQECCVMDHLIFGDWLVGLASIGYPVPMPTKTLTWSAPHNEVTQRCKLLLNNMLTQLNNMKCTQPHDVKMTRLKENVTVCFEIFLGAVGVINANLPHASAHCEVKCNEVIFRRFRRCNKICTPSLTITRFSVSENYEPAVGFILYDTNKSPKNQNVKLNPPSYSSLILKVTQDLKEPSIPNKISTPYYESTSYVSGISAPKLTGTSNPNLVTIPLHSTATRLVSVPNI